jgi:hypothetical protein
MATKVIPVVSLFDAAESAVAEPAPASVTAADVGTVVPGRGTVLRVTSGGVAGTLTIAAGQAKAKTAAIPASGSFYLPLSDTTYYEQSDGTVHVSADQTFMAVALTR